MSFHIPILMFQQSIIVAFFQDPHLLDSNLIQFHKPFSLWNSVIDKHSIYSLLYPLTHAHDEVWKPACILKWSNSTTLKLGLCIISQVPRNSIV